MLCVACPAKCSHAERSTYRERISGKAKAITADKHQLKKLLQVMLVGGDCLGFA